MGSPDGFLSLCSCVEKKWQPTPVFLEEVRDRGGPGGPASVSFESGMTEKQQQQQKTPAVHALLPVRTHGISGLQSSSVLSPDPKSGLPALRTVKVISVISHPVMVICYRILNGSML